MDPATSSVPTDLGVDVHRPKSAHLATDLFDMKATWHSNSRFLHGKSCCCSRRGRELTIVAQQWSTPLTKINQSRIPGADHGRACLARPHLRIGRRFGIDDPDFKSWGTLQAPVFAVCQLSAQQQAGVDPGPASTPSTVLEPETETFCADNVNLSFRRWTRVKCSIVLVKSNSRIFIRHKEHIRAPVIQDRGNPFLRF